VLLEDSAILYSQYGQSPLSLAGGTYLLHISLSL